MRRNFVLHVQWVYLPLHDDLNSRQILNPLFPMAVEEAVDIADLDALTPSTLPQEVDKQFHILFSMNAVNNSFFFNQQLYPFNGG